MRIQIVNVKGPYKEGRFNKLDLSYISEGVKKDRKLVSIGKTEEVVKVLRNAQADEEYDVELVKEGDYWNWVGITKAVASSPATGSTTRSSYGGDRYETSEERTKKQEYIIRQSCLTNAINYISSGKVNIPAEVHIAALLDIAEQFVDWVYNDKEAGTDSEMKSDLPWKE